MRYDRETILYSASGSPTGARLDYDAERRLTHWQNAPSTPTSQAWFLYDGSGQRVEQYVSGGSGNHTYYLPGNVEEVTPSGTLIKYYSAGGMTIGLNTTRDASGISYLASDGLGSVSEALSPSGTATGAVLYSPYGGVRYTSGAMPTSKGFTEQYADTASSGLDYYGARYYDPSLGQFTSADTVSDGINRYGYVKGNPETFTDPTGHMLCGYSDGSGCKGVPPKLPPPPKALPPAKGWNGCYPHDTQCQGSKAQKDAQNGYDKVANILVDKWGDAFKDWLNKHLNILEMIKDWTLDHFLDWLGGDAAKALFNSLTRNGTGAQFWMLIPWAFSWWESSQSAEWFQDWHNIAHFWSAEESVGADFGYAGLLTVLGGIDAENPGVVAIGYGELDAQDAWGALDDSVYDQLLEFIPYPYVEAGAGHMNMK